MSLCGFGPPGLNKLSSSRARNEASEISLIWRNKGSSASLRRKGWWWAAGKRKLGKARGTLMDIGVWAPPTFQNQSQAMLTAEAAEESRQGVGHPTGLRCLSQGWPSRKAGEVGWSVMRHPLFNHLSLWPASEPKLPLHAPLGQGSLGHDSNIKVSWSPPWRVIYSVNWNVP